MVGGQFLGNSNERNGTKIKITSELLDFLIGYSLAGNVSEMQNLVERMAILAEGDRLGLGDLPSSLFSMKLLQPKTKEVAGKVESRQPTLFSVPLKGALKRVLAYSPVYRG